MRLAIQEHRLPGDSLIERFERALALGLAGIEVRADQLTARVPALADAIVATGLPVVAVNMGRYDGWLSPRLAEREAAIDRLRQAMTDAVDLEAEQVVFVPRFGPSTMPDLTPWRGPLELDAEMLVWLLRGVSDLAYAIGVELDLLPVSRTDSDFINRLEQALLFRRRIKEHPHVKIAASLHHLALAEADWQQALRDHLPHIGLIYLDETVDFSALGHILRDYTGWVVLASDTDLAASLDAMRRAGLV